MFFRNFHSMKIRRKLIGTYIIVVLIPVLMVGIILTNGMKDMAVEQAIQEADSNTARFKSRFNEILREVTDVSDRLYSNTTMANILNKNYSDRWEVVKEYSEFSTFEELRRSYSQIKSIQVYTENRAILDNWEFRVATPEITKQQWYKKAVENKGVILWQYIYNEAKGENNLCLTRWVRNKYGVSVGVLVIAVSNNYVQSILREEPFETIVAIDDGTVVFSKNTALIKNKVTQEGLNFVSEQTYNSIKEVNYHGEPSNIITNAFIPPKSRNMINVFTIVPIDSITRKADEISILGFSIMGVSFIISFIILNIFSGIFSSRIIKLRSEMHKVVEGNFEVNTDIKVMDEIGELYSDLQAMVKSIKQLIFEVYEERLLKEQLSNKQKEIEFKMLASQINPHFLYNALETIRMKAHSKGEEEIASIVKMLARIMRRNLEVTNKLVCLDSELELVSSYLDIQKFRYGDRVNYSIDSLVNINEYKILPLLLQPIVENAFIHGLEGKRGLGRINISIEEDEKFLIIIVKDNGVGMDEKKLSLLTENLEESTHDVKSSIGLRNVNARIKLYYGNDYGLGITSKLNEGTSISIYLPKKEDNAAC